MASPPHGQHGIAGAVTVSRIKPEKAAGEGCGGQPVKLRFHDLLCDGREHEPALLTTAMIGKVCGMNGGM